MKFGKDLLERAASALVLAPLVLAATLWGGLPFALFWFAAGLGVLYEIGAVAQVPRLKLLLAVGGAGIACALGGLLAFGIPVAAGVLALAALAGMPAAGRGGWGAAGVAVGGIAVLSVVMLRGADRTGLWAVLFLYAVVWGTDIGAYFVGRALGGAKLWPRLSPNKTWSGAIGGALAGTLAGVGLLAAAGFSVAPAHLALGLSLSIVSQLGDLSESAFKRAFGVKDTSRIIPGHGGVLDRLDGFLAAALLALLIGIARDITAPAAGLLLW